MPVTEAHRHGVIDPMTGSLLRVPGNGNPLARRPASARMPIFDGRMRYDLQFAYKRMDRSRPKGLRGPGGGLRGLFRAGRRLHPHRAAIKYLPSSATWKCGWRRSPARACWCRSASQVPTPIGIGVMQATQFVSMRRHTRARSANPACGTPTAAMNPYEVGA